VLGTLPGEESLRRREYYAHPRNLFWPILYMLFEGQSAATLARSYREKLAFLAEHRVALWDVVARGERALSADSTIRREQPNAIDALLDAHPEIRAVGFNGTAARRLHDRHFTRRASLAYLALPSTSPAHARLRLPDKLAAWTVLRDTLGQHELAP